MSKKRKPNKTQVDQGSGFYNNSFKDFLKINTIETYSTYNEGKSVVGERFIRTLRNKIFKHMTAISKNFILMCQMILLINTITLFIELLKRNLLKLWVILMPNAMKILIKKILNSKLETMLEVQNIKTFLLKYKFQIGQKKFLLLIKLNIQFLGLMLLMV